MEGGLMVWLWTLSIRVGALYWNTRAVDTFAQSHYVVSAAKPGHVATDAKAEKCWIYNDHLDNYCFQPVAIEITSVYGKSAAPFLSCLAKKLVYMSGDTELQWLHQCLSLAMVTGNTASILAWVQVWSDFSHPQRINQCFYLTLVFFQWILIAFCLFVFFVGFIAFHMFCTLSSPRQYCFTTLSSYPDYHMAYNENTALRHTSLRLKLMRPFKWKKIFTLCVSSKFILDLLITIHKKHKNICSLLS